MHVSGTVVGVWNTKSRSAEAFLKISVKNIDETEEWEGCCNFLFFSVFTIKH